MNERLYHQQKEQTTMNRYEKEETMKTPRKFNAWLRSCVIVVLGVFIMGANAAYAEWHFGIGTGLFRLNAKGDVGVTTKVAGPVKADLDLKPEDFDDLMQSAFGFGGYATNGTWMIGYSFSQLCLGDDTKFTTPGGEQAKYDFDFDITGAEVTVGRPIFKGKRVIVGLHGGVRYTQHDISSDLKVGGINYKRDLDNSWADALIGASLAVPFSKTVVWNTKANAGFGGSNGTYYGNTGVTWRFLKNWSITGYGKYTAVDYENEDKGDSDWYLYDVNEFGYGATVLFNW
jgi:hypothetical protein